MDDFTLIAITSEKDVPDEAVKIVQLLQKGFHRVHLRKPSMEEGRLRMLLEQIPEELRSRITLHDYFNLASLFGCGTQTNARNPIAPEGIGSRSHSCHSLQEVSRHRECDYVTLSPVYDSISKKGYTAAAGLIAEVASADKSQLPPIIALGGVTPEKLPELREAGFAGAAMLGSIWESDFEKTIESLDQFLN